MSQYSSNEKRILTIPEEFNHPELSEIFSRHFKQAKLSVTNKTGEFKHIELGETKIQGPFKNLQVPTNRIRPKKTRKETARGPQETKKNKKI